MTKRKPKSSSWQPGGIELLEVEHFYSDQLIGRLAEFVGSPTGERLTEFKTALLNIAAMLNADLHFEGRPTVPEMRVTLDRVMRSVKGLQSALSDLDPDSRALLCEIANRDPWDPQFEANPKVVGDGISAVFSIGKERVRRTIESIDDLARWLTGARDAIGKARKGRPRQDAINRAVARLRDLWTRHVGRKPTLIVHWETERTSGAFLNFCAIALKPVLSSRALATKIEHAARIAIYGEKPPPEAGH